MTQNCGNVSFLSHADIQNLHENLPIDHEHAYDAVFSNAVLHWCKRDPGGVLETCRRLLRKDGKGRLVIEMGGAMNVIGESLIRTTLLPAFSCCHSQEFGPACMVHCADVGSTPSRWIHGIFRMSKSTKR